MGVPGTDLCLRETFLSFGNQSVEEEGEKERQRVSELKRSKRVSEEGTNQETLGGKFVGRGHWLAVGGKEIYEEIVVEISFIFSVLYL